MNSENIIFEGISDGLEQLNWYLNLESRAVKDKKVIKDFVKKHDFSKLPYETKRKLYIMFDPNQKVSAEIIGRQVELYIDLLNENPEKYDVRKKFPEYHEFISSLYLQDISHIGDDRLFVLLSSLKKIKENKITPEIDEFIANIPTLYTQNIDEMSNRRLSILIGQIKNSQYDELPKEIQKFVHELFIRCAVKTETSDNNNAKFKTYEWFKNNLQSDFSQFNKAYFGLGLYDNTLMDEPTKKLTLKYLVRYANFQYSFIKKLTDMANRYHTTPARILYRGGDRSVYDYANACTKDVGYASFPEYDKHETGFHNYYLAEPREYKTSVTGKLNGLFASMIESKLKTASASKNSTDIAKNLSEFVVTKQMNDSLVLLMSKNKNEQDFEKLFKSYGRWLVDLIHLDSISRKSLEDIIDPENEVLNRNRKNSHDEFEDDDRFDEYEKFEKSDLVQKKQETPAFEEAKPYKQLTLFDMGYGREPGDE